MRTLVLPRFGQVMEEGTITFWHVSEGDTFHIGDLIYEVETEKSSLDVEAKFDGVLAHILVPAGSGEPVPVGTVLALCWHIGEAQDPDALEQAIRDIQREAAGAAAPKPGEAVAARQAQEKGAVPPRRPKAQPRARRLAAELGIEIADLQGTGPDGLITEADVEEAARAKAAPVGRVIEQTTIQKAMARAMERSWREIPQFVQTVRFDASRLLASYRRLKDSGQPVSMTALVLYLAARVIPGHPLVNAEYRPDELLVYDDVNVAVAIDTARGLVTPVVRRAQASSLAAIAEALRELAERARANRLLPDDLTGGTITLSNLGMFGIEWGTPIINPPQSAILFVGAVHEQVVLGADGPRVVPEMALSVACDHRIVDGATAARFTAALRCALAEPEALLEA